MKTNIVYFISNKYQKKFLFSPCWFIFLILDWRYIFEDSSSMSKVQKQRVQTYGRKKTATAVAVCQQGSHRSFFLLPKTWFSKPIGHGSIRVNGRPLHLVEPQALRFKLEEPIYLLGRDKFSNVDIRVRVKGGGRIAQVYAIRQALAKSIVSYNQKFVDEATKKQIRDILVQYDRSLLVADPRRC